MYHLRRFLNSSSALQSSGDATNDNPLGLPTELLILIASFVRCQGDLARLCRASKKFKDVYTSILYQSIEVHTGRSTSPGVAAQLSLYKKLQSTSYSQTVTEFRVVLVATAICTKHVTPTTFLPASLRRNRWSCDKYDEFFGKALLSLHHLEVLDIQCELCPTPAIHGHDYILTLDMPRLKQFRFACKKASMRSMPPKQALSFLQAPCIRHLTALSLECEYIGWSRMKLPEMFSQNKGILANLKVLRYNDDYLCGSLIASRPVERICLEERVGGRYTFLNDRICQSPGKLTHLFMNDTGQCLPYFMSRNLNAYVHLTHIGTISFRYLEDNAALHDMKPFKPLINLELIEINRNPYYETSGTEALYSSHSAGFSPQPSFFTLLGEQHPKLRRILLQRRTSLSGRAIPPRESDIASVLWERRVDWERRTVTYQNYWDILNRGMEDL